MDLSYVCNLAHTVSQNRPDLNMDSVFISCRQMEEQAIDRTNSALHGYQQQLVDCISKGQNHIIVAPTGSGKTRVAVEVAGLLFQRKPSARILFLTPTVALAEQQTGQHFAVCPGQSRLGLAVQMCAIALLHYVLRCDRARTACCGTWLFCYASFILLGCLRHQDIIPTLLHVAQIRSTLHNMQGDHHNLHNYLLLHPSSST